MSREHVLVTGGAGFIGSHLADHLLARGDRVRALDSLVPQVHGESGARPPYLDPRVELLTGDVRDPALVRRALSGIDSVVHLAARVGVGQSMYQIADYVGANDVGSAVLLEAIAAHPVRRLVVASSMSVYGEGLYVDPAGNPVSGATVVLRETQTNFQRSLPANASGVFVAMAHSRRAESLTRILSRPQVGRLRVRIHSQTCASETRSARARSTSIDLRGLAATTVSQLFSNSCTHGPISFPSTTMLVTGTSSWM